MGGIQNVWPPVAEAAAAVVIPAAPFCGVKFFAVRVWLCHRIHPLLPVDARGEWFARVGGGAVAPAMPAARAVHVGGDASDVFDDTGFAPCFELKIVGAGVSLIAHLSDEVRVLSCHAHESLSLAEGVGEWLFDIHVLAE